MTNPYHMRLFTHQVTKRCIFIYSTPFYKSPSHGLAQHYLNLGKINKTNINATPVIKKRHYAIENMYKIFTFEYQ
jgi:hypothetical protein